jgi:hypothetical protein
MPIEREEGAMAAALAAMTGGDDVWAEAAGIDPGALFLAVAGGWAEVWTHPQLGTLATLTPLGAARLSLELDERWGWTRAAAGVAGGGGYCEEPEWVDRGAARGRTREPAPHPGMRPVPRWMEIPDPGPGPAELAILAEEAFAAEAAEAEARRPVLTGDGGEPILLWGLRIPLPRPRSGRRAG